MCVEQKRRVNNLGYLSLLAGKSPLPCVSNKGLLSVSYRKNLGVRHVFMNLYGKSSDIFQQEQKRVSKLSQINTKKKKERF